MGFDTIRRLLKVERSTVFRRLLRRGQIGLDEILSFK